MTASAFNPASFAGQLAGKKRKSWSPPLPHSKNELEAIAELCAVPPECLGAAIARGLLYVTTSREGIRSFVVTDSSRNAGVAYRIDGDPWELPSPQTKKTVSRRHRILPASMPGWPIGLPETASFPAVVLVECGIDLICSLHLSWCAEHEELIAPVALLSYAPIEESALSFFGGKRVRLFPHAGTPEEVIEYWGDQLLDAAATKVEQYRFDGLLTTDEQPVQNLRDFITVAIDQWDGPQRDIIELAFESSTQN
jgi:hypothetical protein